MSDGYWRRRLGADPSIVGKSLTLNGAPFQVIGVMPPDFVFPYPGMLGPSGFTRVTGVDVWVPIAFSGPMAANNRMLTAQGQIVRNVHWWGAIGRLKPGVSAAAGRSRHEDDRVAARTGYPATNKGWSATVVPSIDQSVGAIRPALMILLAGIAFVLVMASVNVANLLLARSIAREKELATRAALGAGRARIVRQLLTESVLFALAGGHRRHGRDVVDGAGPDRARAGGSAAHQRSQRSTGACCWPPALTTMITGILVGVLPALSSASVNPQASLQDASRGTVGGALRRRARAGLVIAEVALAVAITTGAGAAAAQFRVGDERQSRIRHVAAADVADEHSAAPDQQRRSPRLLSRLLRAHRSAARRRVGRRYHPRAARQHVGVDDSCRSRAVRCRRRSCRKSSSGAPCTTTSRRWAFRSAAAAASIRTMTARRRRWP